MLKKTSIQQQTKNIINSPFILEKYLSNTSQINKDFKK